MKYREEKSVTVSYKEAYVKSLEELLDRRQKEAAQRRAQYSRTLLENQEQYRLEFKRMLGWPLVDYEEEGLPQVTAEKLAEEAQPLVILQHGGQGTPERIGGVYGDTSNYNDMLHRVRQHGVHVFAPQLLLWADEYEVPFDRKMLDGRLKRVGSSITAVEIYGISRILDYFEAQPEVTSFGMVGLSYGGFYTLFTAAVDTRIQSAISCAYFNTRDQVGWSDWTWFQAAERFDDAEIACLVYPRRLCLEIANRDELFDHTYGSASFEQLKEICQEVGTDWTELIVFDGVHEFCPDDAPIERLIEDLRKRPDCHKA